MRVMPVQRPDNLPVIWLVMGAAVLTAVVYLMMGWDILGAGDLTAAEGPPGIIYVAAGSYLVGGLLILLRRRWLWIMGAVINALVILFFFSLYAERPSVLLSPGGLFSKAAQILLEVGLIYLIVSDWLRKRQNLSKL